MTPLRPAVALVASAVVGFATFQILAGRSSVAVAPVDSRPLDERLSAAPTRNMPTVEPSAATAAPRHGPGQPASLVPLQSARRCTS